MNILIISSTFKPSLNGVAIYTERIVSELRAKGHKVYLVVPSENPVILFKNSISNAKKSSKVELDTPEAESYTSDVFHPKTFPNPLVEGYPLIVPLLTRGMKKWLRNKQIDVIHTQQPFVIGDLAFSIRKFLSKQENSSKQKKKSKHIPIFFTYHTNYDYYSHYLPLVPDSFSKDIIQSMVLSFCEKSDCVLTPSGFIQRSVEDMCLANDISTPIELSFTAGLERVLTEDQYQKLRVSSIKKHEIRKTLKLPKEAKVLINVSRHASEKNLESIVEMGKKLAKDFVLVMVGNGSEHAALVRKAESSSNILFTGALDQGEVYQYLQASDAFVYSTKTDTLGISILEALSVGLPVVAVRVENTEELLDNGKTAVLVEPNDDPEREAKSLLNGTHDLFADEKKYQKISLQAWEEAQKYHVSTVADELVEIYQKFV